MLNAEVKTFQNYIHWKFELQETAEKDILKHSNKRQETTNSSGNDRVQRKRAGPSGVSFWYTDSLNTDNDSS